MQKPEIKSINYNAPALILPGDMITVDVTGTPRAAASFEVKGLIPETPLVEQSPGVYRASAKVPANKTVSNVPLVARLAVGSTKAIPIQASRLITVSRNARIAPKPQVILAVDKSSERSEPKIEIKPEPKPATPEPLVQNPIVLTNPPNGSKIQRAILVRGKADPDTRVIVTVTYANGMSGILKLSGQLASESIAVGKDGEFRMGPIALEGPMATPGLLFTIKAYYPDRNDHSSTLLTVTGDRS